MLPQLKEDKKLKTLAFKLKLSIHLPDLLTTKQLRINTYLYFLETECLNNSWLKEGKFK